MNKVRRCALLERCGVPFALGRPLGTSGNTEFQKDVMRAAFGLLDSTSEPTIVDYPNEAPPEGDAENWVLSR